MDDIEAPWVSNPEPYRNAYYNLTEEEPDMSLLHMYDPDVCDGDFCPSDCDNCPKADRGEEEEDDGIYGSFCEDLL